jgi:hypothetical protein
MAHRQYTLAFYIFTGRHHFGGFALPPGAALLVKGHRDSGSLPEDALLSTEDLSLFYFPHDFIFLGMEARLFAFT